MNGHYYVYIWKVFRNGTGALFNTTVEVEVGRKKYLVSLDCNEITSEPTTLIKHPPSTFLIRREQVRAY